MLDKVIDLYQFPESLNYIYLDVKPENMIVCRNSPDEDYDLKLIDFGISYILDFSRTDEKEKKKIRAIGNKIMLATFLINCLKFYDVCREFCDELCSLLNQIITKALIFLKSGDGLGKLTRKKKGSNRKSKKKVKSKSKSKSK